MSHWKAADEDSAALPRGGTKSPGTQALGLVESIQLSAALAATEALRIGLRSLVVKGPALEHHGLRAGHISSDIDLLVEPDRHEELCAALGRSGWEARAATSFDGRLTHHSVTLVNAKWPNDIDVHYGFPGLLVGRSAAFEVLWKKREAATIGGMPCWVADYSGSIVLWALHSIRGSKEQARHDFELRQIVQQVLPRLSRSETQELADRILELGADEPLRAIPEFRELLGNRVGPTLESARDDWLSELAQTHDVSPWSQVLERAEPEELPRLLLRAIWPSAHDLRLSDEQLVDTPLGRVQSRGRRAWRLVRRIVQRRRQGR